MIVRYIEALMDPRWISSHQIVIFNYACKNKKIRSKSNGSRVQPTAEASLEILGGAGNGDGHLNSGQE